MTMAAIGIGAGIGAAMSMGVAAIQKKPLGQVLLAGAQGAVIGGATAGFGSYLSAAPPVLPNAVEPIITNAASTAVPVATEVATDAAVPLTSAATEATPVLSEVAGKSASTVANRAPTFGQSALKGIGKSAAPSLLAEAPSSVAPTAGSLFQQLSDEGITAEPSLASTLNMPSQWPLMDSLDVPAQQELVNTDIYTTPEADPKAWTNADYTAAINAGSSAINTGVNLAKSPPSDPANYTQNQYGPQSGASDSLMNSLINLSRS